MNLPSLSARIRPLIAKTGWDTLARMEKLLVGILAVTVCTLLLFHFLFSPLLDSRKRLHKSLLSKEAELQEMYILQKEHLALQRQTGDIQERLTNRAKTFTLFSFIEQQATAATIKQKISYLKPREIKSDGPLQKSQVDMKLQKVRLEDLVRFLQGLESHENVIFINRISIQEHGKKSGYLDVVIQIITFKTEDT